MSVVTTTFMECKSVLNTMLNTSMDPLFSSLQQNYKEAAINISNL